MKREEIIIVLIEDDPNFKRNFTHQLKDLPFAKINTFALFSDALMYDLHTADLIIIDEQVNGLNGIDQIPYFRSIALKTTIVYLSKNRTVESFAKAKLSGADYIFTKDSTVHETIKKLLLQLPKIPEKQQRKRSSIKTKLPFFRPKKPQIYLLDDDKLFNSFVHYKLNKDAAFDLVTFNDSELFLAAVKEKKPQLVLLDYNLTNQTSRKMVDLLKEQYPLSKIVMLSGQSDVDVAMELFTAGISDYVVKNKEWESTLRAVIHKHLNF